MTNWRITKSPSRSKRKHALQRMIVARSDIHASMRACQLLIETVDHLGHDLYEPLYAAIVVCYARPYVGTRTLSALPKKWAKFPAANLQTLHDQIIRARHELIAHSDSDARYVNIVPPNVPWDNGNLKSTKVGYAVRTYYFPLGKFKEVYALAADVHSRLHKEVLSELENLYGGMMLPAKMFRLRIDEGL